MNRFPFSLWPPGSSAKSHAPLLGTAVGVFYAYMQVTRCCQFRTRKASGYPGEVSVRGVHPTPHRGASNSSTLAPKPALPDCIRYPEVTQTPSLHLHQNPMALGKERQDHRRAPGPDGPGVEPQLHQRRECDPVREVSDNPKDSQVFAPEPVTTSHGNVTEVRPHRRHPDGPYQP